jgi:hypothetical protein
VVIGKGGAIDSGGAEKVDRAGMRAKVKCLDPWLPFEPLVADDAFQIDQSPVGIQEQWKRIPPDGRGRQSEVSHNVLIN